MALAYQILAHKNAGQVSRLFRILYNKEDVFVLHFDRRATRDLHVLGETLAGEYSNVILQSPRRVLWGGPQIPNLQIEAMGLALNRSEKWHHFINLSGQDFPLQPRKIMVDELSAQANVNFVSWFDPFINRVWGDVELRVERWHFHSPLLERVLSIPGLGRRLRVIAGWQNQIAHLPYYRRRRPDFFQYFGGSNHVVLARESCEHLISDSHACRIRNWLAHSAIPDESIFQSVLLNSHLASKIVHRTYRFLEFRPGTPHPITLRTVDFDRLLGSGEWFARKFDESVDSVVLDRLERSIRSRSCT